MKALLFPVVLTVGFCAVTTPQLAAQDFWDFMTVRNRPLPYRNVFQARTGFTGTLAEDRDTAAGRDDEFTGTGFLYYHTRTGGQTPYEVDAFAGRDGLYLGLKDQMFSGKQTQGRFEAYYRPFAFYREGFYRGDDFVPTGRYDGQVYGVRLGISRPMDSKMRLEFLTYIENLSFDRNNDTEIDYVIPDDHIAYGARLTLEQSTLQLDRRTGLPSSGYIANVSAVREQNDSSGSFGVVGGFETELAKGFWRAELHVEYYFKSGEAGVWEILVDGSMADEEDRIQSYRADRPIGNWWADATVGYRIEMGDSFFLTPFTRLQYTKTLDDSGRSTDTNFWFGGGASFAFAFGDGMALIGKYSYLSNPYRAPITWNDDVYGEHQFFIGLDVTFSLSPSGGR